MLFIICHVGNIIYLQITRMEDLFHKWKPDYKAKNIIEKFKFKAPNWVPKQPNG